MTGGPASYGSWLDSPEYLLESDADDLSDEESGSSSSSSESVEGSSSSRPTTSSDSSGAPVRRKGKKKKKGRKRKPAGVGPLAVRVTAAPSVRRPLPSDKIRPTQLQPSLFRGRPPVVRFDTWNNPSQYSDAVPASRAFLFLFIAAESSRVTRDLFRCSGFAKTEDPRRWNAIWSKNMKAEKFRELLPFQKFNHWPGTWEMGRKDRMYFNLMAMARRFGVAEFDFVPRTFVMPHDVRALLRHAEEDPGGLWIVKPCAAARGKGIRVLADVSSLPFRRKGIVQRYIPRPLLVRGRKFDLRLYVCVTSVDPLRAYIHENGLVRFATRPYVAGAAHASDLMMHVTNYTLQRRSGDFVVPTHADDLAGDKWSLAGLAGVLASEHGCDVASLWATIDDMVLKTILSVLHGVRVLAAANVRVRGNCYEVFGFDVMVDADMRPWLLEVNISPSFASASPLDKELKGEVVRDVFNMVGFAAVDPRRDAAPQPRSAGYSGPAPADDSPFSVAGLAPDELAVLHELEDEAARRGRFRRIAPCEADYQRMYPQWSRYDAAQARWLAAGLPASALDVM